MPATSLRPNSLSHANPSASGLRTDAQPVGQYNAALLALKRGPAGAKFCPKPTRRLFILLFLVLEGCRWAASAGAQTLRIMPFGDSNTRGTMSEPDGGYRWPLQRLLDSAGIANDFVGGQTLKSAGMADPEHQGIGGWRLTHLLDGHADTARHLSSPNVATLLETYRPGVILLMGGTNDVFGGASGEEVAGRLDRLLSRIFERNPSVNVLVSNLLPMTVGVFKTGEVKPGHVVAATRFNALVPGLVDRYRQQNRSIRFVDIHQSVRPDQLIDHVHPDTAGMRQMALAWFEALRDLRIK